MYEGESEIGVAVAQAQPLASDPVLQVICPLALRMRRVSGSVVGRPTEMAAIESELGSARNALSSITVEGEPGIGKTRLLLAATELAYEQEFTTLAVAADEELRGPFLLMRSILAPATAADSHATPAALEAVHRAIAAMSGRDDPGLEGLPSDQKVLRIFDLTTLALQAIADERPLGIFVDDLQWADEDSIRALRYVVRTIAGSPIFLMLALRPEETAFVNEAVTFIADMERNGLVRRLRLGRFTQMDTAEFLRQLMGGKIDLPSAAAVHAQAEGVPFIIEELSHAYRDAGMIQEIDGTWSLARNAERLVPSAVQTLIQRRAGRLPDATKAALAEAAVLGRSFSLRDLAAVQQHLGGEATDPEQLAEAMAPAVTAGLLAQHAADAPADYSFAHDQVREFALAALSAPRKRTIHAAILEMLTEGGDPPPESLPLLARHAAAAGDAERAARFAIESARAALASHAPEEVLRAVELALPVASGPQERITLLSLRDDALEMLRRPADRLEGLTEIAALADALGDPRLELGIMLRRAAALRLAEENEPAAQLAGRVRELAVERGDRAAELAACLEFGQALLRTPLGEGFVHSPLEADLDGAEEAFGRAVAIAEELGDDASLAAAERELGVIFLGRQRAWFVERVKDGQFFNFLGRAAAGETPAQMVEGEIVAEFSQTAERHLRRALELFEKLGDRRGVMSSVIAMAYRSHGPDIHLGTNAVQRIEEIRRLSTHMHALTRESDRAAAEAQMLYGVHVFARAKSIPDLAVSRGQESYRAAQMMGDRSLEFLSAGGVALALLDLGELAEAGQWLDRAAAVAASSPTPLRARQLEFWRGLARAAAGDASGMRDHLERALRAATEQARPAARCEILGRLALESARLGALKSDVELLEVAERSAQEAKELLPLLPANPPWGAQADAALAAVHLARGNPEEAAKWARGTVDYLMSTLREDIYPEMVLPAAAALIAGGEEHEKQMVRDYLRFNAAIIAQRIVDEGVRVRWFRGPVGREFVRLVGTSDAGALPGPSANGGAAGDGGIAAALDPHESGVLALLTEGLTNPEIAARLGVDEATVALKLQTMFAKIGASSRVDATVFALREGVV